MTKPLKKTKGFCIIVVFLMLIMLSCFTTACTSTQTPESIPIPAPDSSVQPAKDPNIGVLTDEKLSDDTPAISDEQQDIPEDVLQALKKYAINNEQTFEYLESEDYFSDRILYYFGDDITLYGLFESDLSLKELGTKTYDFHSPVEITEDEANTIILNYVKKYWPHMEAEITEHKYYEDDLYRSFSVYGVLKNPSNQSEQPFWASVNGRGELTGICQTPDINIEQCIAEGTVLSLDQAKDHAYNFLNGEAGIVNVENLKTSTEHLCDSYDDMYPNPMYIFEFEYRSDNPTTSDFDYNAHIEVKPSTGECTRFWIVPILDNIDVIPMEEAEQKAKDHIATNYDLGLKDLSISDKHIDVSSGKIFYSFCFDYREGDGYSVTMLAETGEIDGIGHSVNIP